MLGCYLLVAISIRFTNANDRKDAANIGFDDDFIYQEIEVAPQYRKKPSEILLRDEAIKVFQLWDEKLDKTEY